MFKTCSKCGIEYLATNGFFNVDSRSKDGLHSQCKTCRKYTAMYYRQTEKYKLDNRQKHYKKRNPKLKADYTIADIQLLLATLSGRCAYCDNSIIGQYTIDHIIPLSLGGQDKLKNITLCCHSCNSSKGDRLPFEYSYLFDKSQFKQVNNKWIWL